MTYTQEEKRSRIRGIVGAASGNLVEWFDFYIYAVFAAYFTQALTAPDMDSTTKSIYVWGVFAASFFMRPIGSWLFGRIADRHGRKKSMIISICLMALSSFLYCHYCRMGRRSYWYFGKHLFERRHRLDLLEPYIYV